MEWQNTLVTCHENLMDCIKGQKYMTTKDEFPRSEVIQYVTGEEQRTVTNSPRKNEVVVSKWKRCSVVDVPNDES